MSVIVTVAHRRVLGTLVVLLVAALLVVAPHWGAAVHAQDAARSLPSVDSGPRPGPDALYAPPPRAPQLENAGPWEAEPILVSGAQAYRDGEWLYQDFLFDDHGATGVQDPNDPYGPGDHLYSPPAGTFTYPTDPVFAHNAADLVELRVKPLDGETRFRVTLNTLKDPDLTAFTLALGTSEQARDWPHGAGVSSPAELFVTVHGGKAELVAGTGEQLATESSPDVSVDMERRQLDVGLPHAVWDPGDGTARISIGVGLWDPGANAYLAPRPGEATETIPGGGTPNGVALVNVGPRFDEPTPLVAGVTMADTAVGAKATAPWWRERNQSVQLSAGDVSPFFAEVDFGKLATGESDESGVPQTGPMNRIFASRYVFGQGVDPSKVCFEVGGENLGPDCIGRFVGQLHPYAVYVPDQPTPPDGYGLTLLLHSLSANYNQYLSTRNQTQLGERGAGSIVVTPGGRGPDGFYKGIAEADTFEVWADVARRYRLDPSWVTVSGYSMGGYGTYRMLARYPDLFARGFSVVGVPGTADDQLASLLHTPVLAWNAAEDELVHVTEAEEAHEGLVAAGIPHTYDLFPTADHLTLAGNDEYGIGAEWLGENRLDRDPPRVRYVVDPTEDSTDVVADHAYWLSELEKRDGEDSPTGTIDVRSLGFGESETEAGDVGQGGGVLVGGNVGALSYVERTLTRTEPEPVDVADRLEITATNIRHVAIDVERARVSCDPELVVESDGPIEIELAGCDRTASFPPSASGQPSGPTNPAPAADSDVRSGDVSGTGTLPATGAGLPLGLLGLSAAALLLSDRHSSRRS